MDIVHVDQDGDLDSFRSGSLVVDVSCDEGMGFSWARPVTFEGPTSRRVWL